MGDANAGLSLPVDAESSRGGFGVLPRRGCGSDYRPLARPGFNQSNVSKTIDFGSNQITVGNPDLKPAKANSFDLTIEKYLASAGILSFGIFDKEFKDYIVPNQTGFQSLPGAAQPLRVFTFNLSTT
jgi:outer membrane receptor protein involved in Fe transport